MKSFSTKSTIDSMELTSNSDSASRRRSRILVFRIGHLGDTIVSLPAMWAIREHFKDASLTLLCDSHPGKNYVLAADLLRRTGIFDEFEYYPVENSKQGKLLRVASLIRLSLRLRREKYDALVYLAPTIRSPYQVNRDRWFFKTAGINTFFGMTGFVELPKKIPGQPLASTPSEADMILNRLAADGIPIPEPQSGSLDLNLGSTDEAEVDSWLATLPSDNGRLWLGVGPGSKMPAKRWPVDRFEQVVARLIEQFDVWPVVFGGAEDSETGERLLKFWGRGYSACGPLSLRGAATALKRCLAYVGNDTGTMHLAASAKTPCVGIFSARAAPGAWSPYGLGHRVFQVHLECEGCRLVECIEQANECLKRVTVDQVYGACSEIVGKQIALKSNPSLTR